MRISDWSSDVCSSDLEDEVGTMVAIDYLPRKNDLVTDLQADPAKGAEVERARAGARPEIDVAGREPRQADRRKNRAHRHIFAIGHQMRLVVELGRASCRDRGCQNV